MRILVVGKGGREHALVRALVESPGNPEVFCFPGSDAIFELAKPVAADGLETLVAWMTANAIDLCVAGEESYLVTGAGLANRCEQVGIPCWGPPKESAQLEASKEFSKNFMLRNGIPTARATACSTHAEALAAIGGVFPTVLKFDGLAAGKGVAVCPDEAAARGFLDEVFTARRFGEGRVLVEECLVGPEVSVFAAIVDEHYLVFTPARDYKRVGEGDTGPNTGGMGAVASRQLVPPEMLARIEAEIIAPTVAGLRREGLPYRGFLYFGLMLTAAGPKVIEYNCRFGDPECQAVMPLVRGDLAGFCLAGAQGQLRPELLSFDDGWSVCVILASACYPESSRNGDAITGLDTVATARIYHAGTRRTATGGWETHGGRVLAVVAGAATLPAAVTAAHQAAGQISFDGLQRRRDIGILHFSQPPLPLQTPNLSASPISLTLDAEDIAAGVARLAAAIRTQTAGAPIALVGIRRRGDEVAERVLTLLAEDDDRELAFGILDISLYRDDFEHLHENPKLQGSDIPFQLDGAHVILVDDVLFTGRTIRAALDALSDYGRAAKVELAVLIDRGHREMPIQPDYTGITLPTQRLDHVLVSLAKTDGADEVRVIEKPHP